ncbi:MAG: hypothetical protein RBT02_11540 [Bacteroidales bacterium]|jgi:hypothetical protein|nr:hypothetical protein [Bacteroidales bacterium]
MRRVIITVIILLVLSVAAFTQEIKVTSSPDTSAILIGDQTGFSVTAEMPAGMVAGLLTPGDTLAGKIVVLSRSPRDTATLPDGNMTITDRYLITSFDSGSFEIPPFYAEVASGDSLIRFYSDYSSLKVLRPDIALQDTTDVIFDIVPPRNAPVTFAEILPWLVIAVIAAIVLYFLARLLPRNPLRRFVRPLPPPEPAHVIALRELTALRNEELWQRGEVKEYYSRLSDILRRYIDNRYGISSPELTTDETVRMLQKAAVTTGTQMSMVKELLSISDMVKFAKYVPESGLHEKCHDDSIRFVEETKMTVVTEEETKEKGGNNA